MMSIQTTYNLNDVCSELAEQSKKEGLLFSKNILFFVLFEYSKPIAFFGLKISSVTAIMKCDYVQKINRGKRLLYHMINYRLNWIKSNRPNIKTIYANTTEMALGSHIKSGGKIIKRFENKVTRVKHEIL